MNPSIFAAVEMAPRDPILGLNEAFNADTQPTKVNLGVGVYYDDDGKIPAARRRAYRREGPPRSHAAARLPADRRHRRLQQRGAEPAVRQGFRTARHRRPRHHLRRPGRHRRAEGRRRLPQAPAARGQGLHQRSELGKPPRAVRIRRLHGRELPLLRRRHARRQFRRHEGQRCRDAGQVDRRAARLLPQPDRRRPDRRAVGRSGRRRASSATSCPSSTWPTRASPTASSPTPWRARLFSASGLQFVVSSSFSKSFSLYGERVGALSIVTASKDEAARVLSQVKRVIRTNYSNPPTHGGAVVAAVLASPELRQMWEDELAGMRDRIRAMRTGLVDKLTAAAARTSPSSRRQRGMFSYTGLTAAQVERLKRRVRHLRRQHRPHLPGRAQHAQHRLRRQGHRPAAQRRLMGEETAFR
jgi:hypothetical protein